MPRFTKPKSKAIKDYYENLRYSTGKTSKQIAEKVKMTAVNFSNLTWRLDQLTGEKIALLAKELGVAPGVFLDTILMLRRKRTVKNDVEI